MVARRANDVAKRRFIPLFPGEGSAFSLEKGSELVAEGYSMSLLRIFDSTQRRFVEFCELDGCVWETAGKQSMVAWLGFTFETSSVSGSTIEQYANAVNRAYETGGLALPAKPLGSRNLYNEVRNHRRIHSEAAEAGRCPAEAA